MNVLVVFETYSGGTQVAAETISEILSKGGASVQMKKARDTKPEELASFDLVVFGSPSWLQDGTDGQPHQRMMEFLEEVKKQPLAGKKFAIYGLGDRDFARFTHAVDIIEEVIKKQGGTLMIEPLRLDSFWFKEKESHDEIATWAQKLQNASSAASARVTTT